MKLIEVVTDQGGIDTVEAIAEQQPITDYWRVGVTGESRTVVRLLVDDQARQRVVDALQSALLLAVNVVSVNLAAKVVLLTKGVKPRTWLEKRKARQSTKAYLTVWAISLLLLVLVISLRT